MASKAPLVSKATLVPRESREILAPSDQRVLPAWLDSLAKTVRMASLEPRVCVVTVAHKESVVSLVPLVLKVSREARVPKVALVHVDSKVSKVPRENVDLLAPVLEAPLAPWVPRESVVRWASKEPRETLAPLVLKVLVAATVSRVTRVLLAPWAALASEDPRAIVESRDPRETLVSKAPRETREMSASEDRVVRQA